MKKVKKRWIIRPDYCGICRQTFSDTRDLRFREDLVNNTLICYRCEIELETLRDISEHG